MDDDSTLVAARAFARNLNILLKSVRLYGFQHDRTAVLFETTWSGLRAALNRVGEAGLLLGVSGTQVLLDGVPLEAKPTDHSFAQLLSAAGLSSLHFSSRLTPDDFARFVRVFATHGPKTGSLSAQLRATLAEKGEPAIRVNEMRFVAQDAALAETGVATELATRSLGTAAGDLHDWLRDPQKLLQLIAAAEGARRGAVAPQAVAPGPTASQTAASPADAATLSAQEEDVVSIIRLLSQLGRAGSRPDSQAEAVDLREQLNQLPAAAQMTLTQALSRLAAAPPASRRDTPLLLELAQHVAIRFALERYERGEVRINAVVELLDRMKREMRSLRDVLKVDEDKMGRAGLEVESHADILDRQFWAGLPESAKRKILLSTEAWAIPPRNLRQFVEQLLERHDAELARSILLNYAACIHAPASEARRKASLGLTDLADLYLRAQGTALQSAIDHIGEQLKREQEAELQTLLGASFVRFSHEAGARRHYPAVRQALISLDSVEQQQPLLAQLLWPRIRVNDRLQEFIGEAVREARLPVGLMEVLARLPQATVEQAASRLSRSTRRDECDQLVALVEALGAEGVGQLRKTLISRPPAEAVSTLALLSRLQPSAIEELLPGRLREWDRVYHDQAVRQLALSGAPGRGRLLLNLLDRLDPLVLPEAVDEIGMSGGPADASRLLNFVEEGLEKARDAFLGVKAIEALGRLRDAKAPALLRPLVEARQHWRWQHPRELRITAAQALSKIDPDWARSFLPGSGLSDSALSLAPLDPVAGTPWMRQRRYERIRLAKSLNGSLSSPEGDCHIAIEGLSLGGGVGQCQRHLRPGTMTSVELRAGLARVRADVLVRESRPQQLSFEVVRIGLEDRSKLRRPLSGPSRGDQLKS